MTLKNQKIIKYVPIAQLVTIFCWIGYYRKNGLKYSFFLKTFLKMVAFFLVMTIPRMILHLIFKNDVLDNTLYYILLYPTFLGIATIAVADQERHEGNQ